MSPSLSNLPKIANLVNRIVNPQQSNRNSSTNDFEKQLKGLPLADITKFVEQNMHDVLRVELYPDIDHRDQNFVSSANQQFFRYSTTSLISMYSHIIDANWLCLLQVNQGSFHQILNANSIGDSSEMQLESALEQLADHLTTITSIMKGVKFPSVAATPIGIFREIE